MSIKNAQVICVGTEILIGDIVNTNAAFLSRELASLGISQYRQSVVGDNKERLVREITAALAECDLLILSGGLGPTYDDLTRNAVAKALGKQLVYHEELFDTIREYFERRGREIPECNKLQAYLVDGAKPLNNSEGTAPGQIIEGEKTIVLLPGPPNELITMWNKEAKPLIAPKCEKAIVSKNLNLIGIGESAVAELINDILVNSKNPSVSPYCSPGEVRLRVTACADSEKEALDMCNDMVQRLFDSEIAAYIYGIDTNLPEALVETLRKKDKRITFAESCTGGLLAKKITDIPGASEVFCGSIVTYSDDIKTKLLDIDGDIIERNGAVSHKVAVKMARHARLLFNSDIAIGVTGLAGPGGDYSDPQNPIPAGRVYIAVSTSHGEEVNKYSFGETLSREKIRELAATAAFSFALKKLKH